MELAPKFATTSVLFNIFGQGGAGFTTLFGAWHEETRFNGKRSWGGILWSYKWQGGDAEKLINRMTQTGPNRMGGRGFSMAGNTRKWKFQLRVQPFSGEKRLYLCRGGLLGGGRKTEESGQAHEDIFTSSERKKGTGSATTALRLRSQKIKRREFEKQGQPRGNVGRRRTQKSGVPFDKI